MSGSSKFEGKNVQFLLVTNSKPTMTQMRVMMCGINNVKAEGVGR